MDEATLSEAWTNAASERLRFVRLLASARGVARPVDREVSLWLGGLVAAGIEEHPCAVLAVIDALEHWPELEPRSWLGDVATSPPGGSDYVRAKAIDAMGQTGRADYVPALQHIVLADPHGTCVPAAIQAAASITGDAELASDAIDQGALSDEGTAYGLGQALAPAAGGPNASHVVSELLASESSAARLAGISAASAGVGGPDVTDEVMRVARRGNSAEEVLFALEVARNTLGEGSTQEIAGLALDSSASASARAVAVAALRGTVGDLLSGPGSDRRTLFGIASAVDDPRAMLVLARSAAEVSDALARALMASYARNALRARQLTAELELEEDFALLDLWTTGYPD